MAASQFAPGSLTTRFQARSRKWGVWNGLTSRVREWGWFNTEAEALAAIKGYFEIAPQAETPANLLQAVRAALLN